MMKFFKKEKSFTKADLHFNYGLFWKFAVLIIFLVIILSSFFGYSFFKNIEKEFTSSPAPSDGVVETAKKERISKVLEYFSLREQKTRDILNFPSPVIDPSL